MPGMGHTLHQTYHHRDPHINKADEAPEKLCNSFYKHTLGIPKYASNVAARGELGIYPLYVYILEQVASFSEHLKQNRANCQVMQ